jgi:transposase
LIGSNERDGDRHHDVSILIASCLMVGRWRGTHPAANVCKRFERPTSRARISSDIGVPSLLSGDCSVATSMLDARNEARNEGDNYRRVEVITGRQRRRRWTAAEKTQIVAESLEAGTNISDVARRYGVARGLLTVWRRQLSSTGASQKPRQGFAAVRIDAETSAPEDSGTSLEPDTVATALPVVRTRGRIEIDIAGARIRVETGVDHATLAMVLAAVRGDR